MSGALFTEAFGRGWTRARGEPDGFAWIGEGVAALRFPRFQAIAGRRAESLAWAPDPHAMMAATAAAFADEPDHWLVTFEPSFSPSAAYEQAGFRLMQSNWLMTREPLATWARSGAARMVGPEDCASAAEAGTSAKIEPGFFDAPGFNLAGVFDEGGRCLATGRSAHAADGWIVVDGMVTRPEARGRGYGRDILALLLDMAAEEGRGRALLVASEQGRRLYEHAGFVTIASCFAFAPVGRSG